MERSSITDDGIYPDFCLLASKYNSVFNNFRNNDIYINVLEHVSFEDAKKCIKEIKNKKLSLLQYLDKFKENDTVGNPNKYSFEKPFDVMAPTTIRYIKILHDLYELFGDLNDKNIVEIGAGCGGQCKVISDAFKFNKYNLVDLKEVNLLIYKYLKTFNIDNFEVIDFDKLYDIKSDLVISNYAFSECSKEIQDIYLDKLLKNAKHGYMICNFISQRFNLRSYDKNELISKLNKYHKINVIEEVPITFANNILITW